MRRPRLVSLALAAAAAAVLAAPALGAKDDVVLISRATGGAGAAVDDRAFSPSSSADGGRVAFETFADALSTEDDNAVINIFVRDVATSATILVSRATGAAGAGANGGSGGAEISGDGRFVAFVSEPTTSRPRTTTPTTTSSCGTSSPTRPPW